MHSFLVAMFLKACLSYLLIGKSLRTSSISFKPLKSMQDVVQANYEVFTSPQVESIADSIESKNPPIYDRLIQTGFLRMNDSEIEFTEDTVSKEILARLPNQEGLSEQDEEDQEETTKETLEIDIKTGIWQVRCFDDDGITLLEPYYIVTAISMNDRVDTKKLQKAIKRSANPKIERLPKVSFAPPEIAEQLTGYISGTMSPICHSVDMKLFLEENLISTEVDLNSQKFSLGSGLFGVSVVIPVNRFLQVATEKNKEGLYVGPIIQKRKKNTIIK